MPPTAIDGQQAREQEDHDAGHRSKDWNIVEQESNGSPQYRIAHPAERHDGAVATPTAKFMIVIVNR